MRNFTEKGAWPSPLQLELSVVSSVTSPRELPSSKNATTAVHVFIFPAVKLLHLRSQVLRSNLFVQFTAFPDTPTFKIVPITSHKAIM